MGVSTFLYPVDGKLTTFMNSAVPADEFLGKLSPDNQLNVDNTVSLLSLGISKGESFFSFDVNMRTCAAVNLPYSLFDFMKTPASHRTTTFPEYQPVWTAVWSSRWAIAAASRRGSVWAAG